MYSVIYKYNIGDVVKYYDQTNGDILYGKIIGIDISIREKGIFVVEYWIGQHEVCEKDIHCKMIELNYEKLVEDEYDTRNYSTDDIPF